MWHPKSAFGVDLAVTGRTLRKLKVQRSCPHTFLRLLWGVGVAEFGGQAVAALAGVVVELVLLVVWVRGIGFVSGIG